MPRLVIAPAKALAAGLLVWVGLTLAGSAAVDRGQARLLLPVLIAFVGAVGLWRPWRFAGAGAGLVSAGLLAAIRLVADGLAGLVLPSLIGLAGLLGTAFLADLLARQTEADELKRRHDAVLIEELTPTHGDTGVMKWQHAARHLADEIGRARRYRHPVTLVLLGVQDWPTLVEQVGAESARQVLDGLSRLVLSQIRSLDRLAAYGDGVLALMLPHTPLAGALTVVDKLHRKAKQELDLSFLAGVAEFPTDAATAEELIREAEAALEFARTAGVAVVSRDLLTRTD